MDPPPPSCCGPVSAAPSGKGSRCGTKAPEREVWGDAGAVCRPRSAGRDAQTPACARVSRLFIAKNSTGKCGLHTEFTDGC